jgi:hypothetical protein
MKRGGAVAMRGIMSIQTQKSVQVQVQDRDFLVWTMFISPAPQV